MEKGTRATLKVLIEEFYLVPASTHAVFLQISPHRAGSWPRFAKIIIRRHSEVLSNEFRTSMTSCSCCVDGSFLTGQSAGFQYTTELAVSPLTSSSATLLEVILQTPWCAVVNNAVHPLQVDTHPQSHSAEHDSRHSTGFFEAPQNQVLVALGSMRVEHPKKQLAGISGVPSG